MEPVLNWDIPRVVRWFSQNGFPGYDTALKENEIDGQVLVNLDHESLKDLGIRALGKRILVLKSIYFLKLQHDIPITSDSYVPQTVDVEPDNIRTSTAQRRQRRQIEQEVSRMMDDIYYLTNELASMRSDMQRVFRANVLAKPLPSLNALESVSTTRQKNPSSNATAAVAGTGPPSLTLPTTSAVPTLRSSILVPSPSNNNSPGSPLNAASATNTSPQAQTPVTPHIRVYGDNALQRENESYKSFRISIDDPCSRVLPHALKKYHIDDDWQNYTLCIQYGNATGKGKKIERRLNLDEKPLRLFQQLKDAGEAPVFVLKLVKPGASPGAMAGSPTTANQVYMTGVGRDSSTSLQSTNDRNASSTSLDTALQPSAAAAASSQASSGSGGTRVMSSYVIAANKHGVPHDSGIIHS
ncbi:hypothetical protein FBU59_004715 [Linderina macrospora]|uniref:Uncharacterized protein n=1 Tax=Linderina macrospora TaxID=4868 RepID=A0ACC1J4S8_9FUNG|nr:hypothetical protein FBU59_004715 [Linderina macrospora]